MSDTKCSPLKITLKGKPDEVLTAVKAEAKKNNIKITGNDKKGTMQHNKYAVSGAYSVKGQVITINMVDSQMFVNCKEINKMVSDFFKGK